MQPFRGTSTGWRDGQRGTFWNSARANPGSSPGEEQTHGAAQAGADLLENSSADKDLEVLVDNKLFLSQQCVLGVKNTNGILGALGRAVPAGQGR